MDPRDIIRRSRDPWAEEERLLVLFDTISMNEQISFGNDEVRRVIQYDRLDQFRFVRSPEDPRYELIDSITPYSIEDIDGGEQAIIIDDPDDSVRTTCHFGYKESDIESIAARVYSEDDEVDSDTFNLEPGQIEDTRKVFVHAALNSREGGHIFITELEVLLENRRWFENHFPGGQLNLFCLSEAIEYLGLYLRYRDEFYASPKLTTGKLGWSWHLFRSLVPYYHVDTDADDDFMRGFSTRFLNLLIAVDEVGFQFFQEPDNRTKLNVQYHFDYGITLVTGVFDALALKTSVKYDIDGIRKEFISLSNNRGGEFLSEVSEENRELRDLIAENMPFINLINVLRPLIVHRGGYQDSTLEDHDEMWTAGVIPLRNLDQENIEDFNRYYREINDEPRPYDPFTHWGMHPPDRDDPGNIEPYHFLKATVERLIPFANEYLELLGYTNFLEERRDSDVGSEFVSTCDRIREDGLTQFYRSFG